MAVDDQHQTDDYGVDVSAVSRSGQPSPETANTVASSSASAIVQARRIDTVELHNHPDQPGQPIPRQLPPAPHRFVGRAQHLLELDERVTGTGREGTTMVTSVVAGTGGVGKTWLALTWAHNNIDRFPDGQLFADLRGYSPIGSPTSAKEVLSGFLEALGVSRERQPSRLDALTAQFRTLMAKKRMLVLLDNAATSDQVLPLLPGTAACTVIVTSRNRLTALVTRHGARLLRLDVLTDTESRQLLTSTLGSDRIAAAEDTIAGLSVLCGGLPLALSLLSARAAAEPHLPLRDAVAALRELGLDALDSDDPAASVPGVLSWSLRRLTGQQRTVFALLGIAPGPDTGVLAAANLTDLSAARTSAVLRELVEASLIDRVAAGRYGMHDLVRAYAASYAHTDLPESSRRAALNRVIDFYLHTAHLADRLLEPHASLVQPDPPMPGVHVDPLPDREAAMNWLETEHAHLLAAQSTAATLHRHSVVWHFAWNLTGFHQRQGHLHDDLTAWRAALTASTHVLDPAARTCAHRNLGRACQRLDLHKEATRHLHRALALAEHHHDPLQQAFAHQHLAYAWGQQGEDRTALEHARRALGLYRVLDKPVQEANALNQVGWFAARLDQYDTARDHCRAALRLHREHHNPAGEALTLDSLGYIDHHTGDHRRAIDHYQQALRLYRTLGNTDFYAATLENLGHPHVSLGQHDRARACWREALAIYLGQRRDADAVRVQQRLDAIGTSGENPGSHPKA